MRLTLLTYGSRGDVQPYVGLGVGLAAHGHRVTVAVSAAFEGLVREAGLRPWVVAPDPRLTAAGEGEPRWYLPGVAYGAIRIMRARGSGSAERLYQDYASASRVADAVLYPMWAAPAARGLHRTTGIQTIAAYLAPVHPTRAFPSPFLPPRLTAGSNRLGHWVVLALLRAALDGFTLPVATPGAPERSNGVLPPPGELCLYGCSPTLVPRPDDWPQDVLITGDWGRRRSRWQPPRELERFLTTAGPVVYVGSGSMVDPQPAELSEVVDKAAARTRCRVVYSPGPGGGLQLGRSGTRLPIGDLPFEWLFPRVDAIVHHGGAGTTSEAARSGKPSFGIPYFGDQPFWLDRLYQLGAGPGPIPRSRLTCDSLASAIDRCLHDPSVKRRAKEVGAAVRAEDGVGQAVRAIEEVLGEGVHHSAQ